MPPMTLESLLLGHFLYTAERAFFDVHEGRRVRAGSVDQSLPPLDRRVSEIYDKHGVAEANFSRVAKNLKRVKKSIKKVRKNLKKVKRTSTSPIQAMKSQVAALLSNTLPVALYLATAMTASIDQGTFVVPLNQEVLVDIELAMKDPKVNMRTGDTWKSCKFVTNFILVVASSKASAQQATKFATQPKAGLPTLSLIRSTPSASFRSAFDTAKVAAQKNKKTTVIGVSLADVHIIQLASRGHADGHFSFAHSFAVAVGPEGFVIWQAWSEHGYRLDEWMKRGGDRVRSWDEAEKFVKDFEKLTESKGPWNSKRNKLYKKLFEVDLNQMCGPKGPEPRVLIPNLEAWVQLEVFEDVKVEDVLKFKFDSQHGARSLAKR